MIVMRAHSPEIRAPARTAGRSTEPARQEASIGHAAPVAADHSSTRFKEAGTFELTPGAIEQALENSPPHRRDLILSDLLARLVREDPHAAARIAEREETGYLRELALRVVAQSWTPQDAVGALNWAGSLSDQNERDTALEYAALELAVSQPRLALQALERRSGPRSPDPTLEGVVQQWATNDFAAAFVWAEAQPAGADRDALLTRLVFVRAAQDPADAARIAHTAFFSDAQRIEAFSTIAHLWGAQDPTAVRELARALDVEAQRRVRAELELLE
jgi:hypothetical protein